MRASPLRLMTFNLRRDVPSDGTNRWERRRDVAAGVIREARPHVLGTQELLPAQVADLDARLPEYRRVGRCRRGGALDEFNAIYFDPGRLSLLDHEDFWLSDTPEEPGSATWGNELPRMATWARFEDRESGGQFDALNTHLDHRSPVARSKSADLIRERAGERTVLMGDFNALPGRAVHKRLTAAYADSLVAAERRSRRSAATFHAFTGRPFARIDWVLTPRGVTVRDHVVPRHRPGGAFPSDHDPVLVEVDVQA